MLAWPVIANSVDKRTDRLLPVGTVMILDGMCVNVGGLGPVCRPAGVVPILDPAAGQLHPRIDVRLLLLLTTRYDSDTTLVI